MARKNHVQQVVQSYRVILGSRGRPMSFARFAAELNQVVVPFGLSISNQSIKNWEDGVYQPNYPLIVRLSISAPPASWQRSFALDLLAAQWPELYKPASEVGRRVLKHVQE